METLETREFTRQPGATPDAEANMQASDNRNRVWHAGHGLLRLAERLVDFLPDEAPAGMSQHFGHAEARNDPAPHLTDPRG